MSKFRFIIFAFLMIGFIHPAFAAEVLEEDSNFPPIQCGQDESIHTIGFFKGSSPLQDTAITQKLPPARGRSFRLKEVGHTKIRLDFCSGDFEELRLERVIYKHELLSSLARVFNRSEALKWRVEGLDRTFLGDYTKLVIEVTKMSRQKEKGFAIYGVKSGRSGLAIGGPVVINEKGIAYTRSNLIAGRLDFGDPFAENGPCNQNSRVGKSDFKLGTANFTIDYCSHRAAGHTTGYDIFAISIKDSSKKLDPSVRNKEIKWTKEDLDKLDDKGDFAYQWNHHNGCDSLYISAQKLGARYALTTSPAAGCGAPVKYAPKRKFNGASGSTHFVIDYGAGFSKVQIVRFAHWLGQ